MTYLLVTYFLLVTGWCRYAGRMVLTFLFDLRTAITLPCTPAYLPDIFIKNINELETMT